MSIHMNSTEIAAQLREIADVYSVGSTNVIAIRKAADMISLMDGHVEDIMMRNQQLVLENEALRQQVEDIKNGFEGCCYACEPVGEMNKKLLKERDAALAVVNEFISDTTFENQTPDHECEFKYSPETGKCDSCEAWGNYVGLFCSREDEEETLNG